MIGNDQARALRVPEELTVGERVRLARVASGLTPKEMARQLEVSLATYQRIERGTRELRLSELNALAAFTGQDVSFFGASPFAGESTLPPPLPVVKGGEV